MPVEVNNIDGVGEGLVISHLLYADYILLFCKASHDQDLFLLGKFGRTKC